jgi:hypothetical protein
MEETELRIKNIVYQDYQKCFVIVTGMFLDSDEVWYCKLSEFNDDHEVNGDSSYRGPIQSFQPIHLTEEWLLKFGFDKKVGSQTTYFKKSYFPFFLHTKAGKWSLSYNNEYDDGEIKHVHQLQNLYFALTGEELTIKE